MQTRLLRVVPATFALYHFNQSAFCQSSSQYPNRSAKLDVKHDLKKGYIEPISKVFFTNDFNNETSLSDLPLMKLVSAGARCMLGESFMCDRPITRVYSYALYIDGKCLDNRQKQDFETVIFHSPHIAKTLSIEVTVGKATGHWVGGFRKSILRRLPQIEGYNNESKESKRKIRGGIKKFAMQFKKIERIHPGSQINVTWVGGKVTTELDGKVIGEIQDNFVGEAIFRTYYSDYSVNPRACTRARRHYREGMSESEVEQQESLCQRMACPDYRECGKRLQFW